MANETANTALPAYLDEFEPEPGKERRVQDILGLIRIATSGGASRTRSDAKGQVHQVRPRFSLMMASVDRPTLTEANASRIVSIRLSAAGVANWPTVRDDIFNAVQPDRMVAVRTHIIRNTANIVRHAREIENELIEEGAVTRDAQIRAALSAGVGFLSADPGFRLGQRAPGLSDLYRPLATLMQTPLRQRFHEDITLADALRNSYFDERGAILPESWADEDVRRLRTLARRYGFKFSDDGACLYAAIDWRAMKDMLRDTPYMHIDLSEYLLRLPGAVRSKSESGHYLRITFGGVQKSVIAIPRDILAKMGLFVFDGG